MWAAVAAAQVTAREEGMAWEETARERAAEATVSAAREASGSEVVGRVAKRAVQTVVAL